MGRKLDAPAQDIKGFIDRLDRKYLAIENISDAELTNTLIFEFYMRTDEFQSLHKLYYDLALEKSTPEIIQRKHSEFLRSEFVHNMSFDQYLFKELDTFEQFGYSTPEIIDHIISELEIEIDEKIIRSNEAIEKYQNDINGYNELMSIIQEFNKDIDCLNIEKNGLFNQPKVEEWQVLEIENKIRDMEKDRGKKEFDLKELNKIIQIIPLDYINLNYRDNFYSISPKYTNNLYKNVGFTIKGLRTIMAEKYISYSIESHSDENIEFNAAKYKFSKPRYKMSSRFEISISLNILENKKELEVQCSEIISELKKHYLNEDVVIMDANDFFGLTPCVRASSKNCENTNLSTLKPQNAFANYFYCYDMMKAGLKPSQLGKYLKALTHPMKDHKIIVDDDSIKNGSNTIETLLKEKKFLKFIPTIEEVNNPNLLNIKN